MSARPLGLLSIMLSYFVWVSGGLLVGEKYVFEEFISKGIKVAILNEMH
jgi:hypothetical protein